MKMIRIAFRSNPNEWRPNSTICEREHKDDEQILFTIIIDGDFFFVARRRWCFLFYERN